MKRLITALFLVAAVITGCASDGAKRLADGRMGDDCFWQKSQKELPDIAILSAPYYVAKYDCLLNFVIKNGSFTGAKTACQLTTEQLEKPSIYNRFIKGWTPYYEKKLQDNIYKACRDASGDPNIYKSSAPFKLRGSPEGDEAAFRLEMTGEGKEEWDKIAAEWKAKQESFKAARAAEEKGKNEQAGALAAKYPRPLNLQDCAGEQYYQNCVDKIAGSVAIAEKAAASGASYALAEPTPDSAPGASRYLGLFMNIYEYPMNVQYQEQINELLMLKKQNSSKLKSAIAVAVEKYASRVDAGWDRASRASWCLEGLQMGRKRSDVHNCVAMALSADHDIVTNHGLTNVTFPNWSPSLNTTRQTSTLRPGDQLARQDSATTTQNMLTPFFIHLANNVYFDWNPIDYGTEAAKNDIYTDTGPKAPIASRHMAIMDRLNALATSGKKSVVDDLFARFITESSLLLKTK